MAKARHSAPVGPDSNEISATDGAKRLGLTAQAVGQWASRPGAPARKIGTRVWLRWPDFARWRETELCRTAIEEATKKLREQLDAMNSPKGNPRSRLDEAMARKAEIEVEELERTRILITEAAAVTEKAFTDLRAKLVPFPRTAAPKVLGAKTVVEMEQRLHKEIAKLMAALAESPVPVESEQAA